MDKLAKLPPPVKGIAGVAGVGALLGIGALIGSGKGLLILLVALITLAGLAFLIFKLWTAYRAKKRSAQLEGEMRSGSAATPRGVSRPEKLAKLEELRSKFEEGIAQFRARGKDFYRLPWYVFVGPPGSGKTEAVRHSGISFPNNMQDPLQGVGGTINMHWWFSNHAVILDTAGRLLFEEVPAGETGEWKEFLKLLRKARPNCPINGLFLTISVDSLIKETANQIQERAGKIAQQLDVIQRTLDVRFPVYIIVTKCDLLRGFREFFESLTDPQLQHQIVGWSNPEPLDAQFRPELTDKFLKEVVQRLQRRRLGLLRDPVAEDPANRRTDEVDAMYALPASLELISSRLRSYLETIFVSGEWSAKPVFLRGIYFTSALREGKELDLALADVLGKSVDELPEGKAWGRERSYFLRDLFMEKAFKEKGLVTRATNAGAMLRRRKLVLAGAGVAALLFAGFFLWLGNRQLHNSIAYQSAHWKRATDGWKKVDGNWHWLPIVDERDGEFSYQGDRDVTDMQAGLYSELKRTTRAEYHARLAQYATNSIQLGIFRPVAFLLRGIDLSRRTDAHRTVFEGGVITPLVDYTRQKLKADRGGDAAHLDRQAHALAALISLERSIAEKPKAPLAQPNAAAFLAALLSYLRETNVTIETLDTNLSSTMSLAYSPDRGAAWPPDWLSAGRSLTNNSALNAGLERFIANAKNVLVAANTALKEVRELHGGLGDFRSTEDKLLVALGQGDDSAVKSAFAALDKTTQSLDAALRKARAAGGVLEKSPNSLSAGYTNLMAASGAGVSAVFGAIQQAVAARPAGPGSIPVALLSEIERRITREKSMMAEQASLKADQLGDLPKFDADFLAEANKNHLYAYRCEQYRKLAELVSSRENWVAQAGGDRLTEALRERLGALNSLQSAVNAYEGGRKQEFAVAGTDFLVKTRQKDVEAYFQRGAQRFQRFPLTRKPGVAGDALSREEIVAAGRFFAELASTNVAKSLPVTVADKVRTLNQITSALVEGNNLANCSVKLRGADDEPWRGYWTVMSAAVENKRTDRGNVELGRFAVDSDITFKLFRTVQDAAPEQTRAIGKWGLVRLLLEKTIEGGGTNWVVSMPISEFSPGNNTYKTASFALELQFDKPVPDPKQWP